MKTTEERIDRTLAGLRAADVPGGLEERVVRAVQQRAVAKMVSSWRLAWTERVPASIGGRTLTAVLSLGLAAFFGVRAVMRQHTARPQPAQHASAKTGPPQAAALRRPQDGAGEAVVTAAPRHAKAAVRGFRPAPEQVADAASYPAPPMPLTDQERLLLRVAHRRDPANVALLNPELQATLIAKEQQQFEKFFAPPPRVQAETPIQTEVKHDGESR